MIGTIDLNAAKLDIFNSIGAQENNKSNIYSIRLNKKILWNVVRYLPFTL